ncbi:MAG: outer membrane beta-barrel protein, partial [Terriglobales bacterium]
MEQHSRRFLGPLLIFGLLVLTAVPVLAQATFFGRIVGVVLDPSGAVVQGASVVAIDEGTGAKHPVTSKGEGSFVIPQLSAGSYTVQVSAPGFTTSVFKQVKVDPGKEYSLTVNLKVGATEQAVEVVAGQQLVNTSSSEVTSTVTMDQVRDLPLNGRNVLNLIGGQPGTVTPFGRGSGTVINGARTEWTTLSLDGINIQDNFIRSNDLDFIPNRPTTDSISEFTITTNTQGAQDSGGSSSVRLVTPSGSNAFHGGVFEYNRNNAVAANSWFNDNSVPTVKKPFLNRNDFGGHLGGPILKNKLFFYGYYEGRRLHQSAALNQVIPAHDDYLQGVFRYVDTVTSTVQTVNVITAVPGVSINPTVSSLVLSKIAAAANANNFNVGDSTGSHLLNTAGFQQNQRNNNTRNVFGGKFDFEMTSRHHFDFTYNRIHEITDRGDLDPVFATPLISNDSITSLYSGGWRWTISPTLVNEFRGGGNFAPAPFNSSFVNPAGFFFDTGAVESRTATMLGINLSPTLEPFQPQGRFTDTRNFTDNASWTHGTHSINFGGSLMQVRVHSYNFRGQFPIVTTGFSSAAPSSIQLSAANFPGGNISSADLASANALRAFLGGVVSQVAQTFQVTSKTSGFVGGAANARDWVLDDYAFYIQDAWRISPRFTLRAGLRWEYVPPVSEANGLLLAPVFSGSNLPAALLNPSNQVDFVKGDAYKPFKHGFGPVVGFALDVFGDGKTAVRGGYSLNYVNNEHITMLNASLGGGNAGLTSAASLTNQFFTLNGTPTVPSPAFVVPRTYAQQLAISPTSGAWGIDPNLTQPKVHQVTLGVSREIMFDTALEVRYVGTFGRDLFRALDLNQNNAGVNTAFLADFARARSNGFIALNTPKATAGCTPTTCGVFNPAFNASLPGSQQLTLIPTVGGGGSLTNSTVRTAIQQNEAARLADFYVGSNRSVSTAAPPLFLANPGIYTARLTTNDSYLNYNGLQAELRRRFKNGLTGQFSYTWSKALTDSFGDNGQSTLEAFLDNARPGLAAMRSVWDIRHAFKWNLLYELPFGRGKMFGGNANGVVNRIIGGWEVAPIFLWQSGSPFSILSNRGTFNRTGITGGQNIITEGIQGALSTLTPAQIKDLLGVTRVPSSTGGASSVYYINPSVISPSTGKAVGPDTLGNTA